MAPGDTTDKVSPLGFLFKVEVGARTQVRGGDAKNILREVIVRYTGGWGWGQADVLRDKKWMYSMLSADADMVGVGLQVCLWLGDVIVGCWV